ncbi:MAG: PilT/PilU family type 4a pilus ATPase [Planctomycetota bacterium]
MSQAPQDERGVEAGAPDLPAGPARLEALLSRCVAQDASDIHLAEGLPPYLRAQGPLEPVAGEAPLGAQEMAEIVEHLRRGFSQSGTGSVDGAFSAGDGTRYRFNIYWRSGGLAVALRRLEDRFRGLQELGLPESLYRLCGLPNGLVVVSGPTGSGKSTTLATLIDRINQSHPCHVITIEDPVEYVHRPAKALVNQREVGTDTASFNEALVASLREDPDVVLVGEIRDTDTIRTAITAAETGHLVFTTVHAGDCVSTIERMVGVFPAEEQPAIRQQLALVLRCVVAQRLLVADGPAFETASALEQARQRVVASEVLMVTPAVSNLVLQSKSSQIYSSMEAGGAQGMQTFEQDLARLMVTGWLSERSALAAAKRPDVVRDRAEQAVRQQPGVPRNPHPMRRTPA